MQRKGALSGVRVLDLSRIVSGAYCGMMLADMGAEVTKVEVPGSGDDSRAFGPRINEESTYFANFNRNKTGITLNLKAERGKELFRGLVSEADILIENFRPGTMEKLGLGYDALRAIRPALVYGAISGFGASGPYRERAGYDLIGQAMSGLMSVTGWPDRPPVRAGTSVGDITSGLVLAIGVLAAYVSARETGIGQKVDISLTDSLVSALTIVNMQHLNGGQVPRRIGNRYEAVCPYDSFRTADGDIVITCGNDKLFYTLADLMGKGELKTDARYRTVGLRVQNHASLKAVIENWLQAYTNRQAVELLLREGIPVAEIFTPEQVAADPHIAGHRGMFPEITQPHAGTIRITGNPIKLSGTPVDGYRSAPQLGEHNREIYGKLGLAEPELRALSEEGII